jgi:hypothetical protein
MPRKIQLKDGQTATVSTEKVIIRDADNNLISKIDLFPERGSKETNETEYYDEMTGEFEPGVFMKSSISGTIDEAKLKYDEKTNTLTGEFSGLRQISEKEMTRFVQYHSNFSLDLNTQKLTDTPIKSKAKAKADDKKVDDNKSNTGIGGLFSKTLTVDSTPKPIQSVKGKRAGT